MALSNMSSRERAIVVVLGVIILVALVGIGLLAARLVSDKEPDQAAGTFPPGVITEVVGVVPAGTITAVVPPDPALPLATAVVGTGRPVEVVRMEGTGPGAPVIVTAQALQPGRRYRIEITAANDAQVKINGSWSQGAVATEGQAAAPQVEFFEGVTPHRIDVVSPVAEPKMWSVSVSAGMANVLDPPAQLVITIWDVTEGQ